MFPLVVSTCLCVAVAGYAVRREILEGGSDGPLQSYCRELVEACAEPRHKLEALLALERTQQAVTIWRIDWLCACATALFVAGASACLCVGSRGVLLVFLVCFLATMLALRCRTSYVDSHITKHPLDARMRLSLNMLGLKEFTGHWYL